MSPASGHPGSSPPGGGEPRSRSACSLLAGSLPAGSFRRSVRGQSEVTGSTLLIGVVAIAVTVAGGLLLAGHLDDADKGRSVDLDATANGTHVTIQHRGGEALATAEVTVVIRQDGFESESSLDTWTLFQDDGDDRFEPAERATTTHGLDPGTVEVVVVHRSSGSHLHDETLAVDAA